MKSNKRTKAKTNGDGKPANGRAARKVTSRSARKGASAAKRNMSSQPANGQYGESAARFLTRAKSAIGDAYGWAGEATSALPKTMRDMGLPSQRSMRNLLEEKPLVLGALGLGIGVALGAMLPPAGQLSSRFSRVNEKRHTAGSTRK